jgi:porin
MNHHRAIATLTSLLVALAFAATTARAEDKVVQVDSDSTHDPIDLRPFQIVLPSGHLLGDWWGVRTKLEDAGIKPSLTLVTDFAWNPSGGANQGSTVAFNLGLDLLFDLDKMAGIKGGSFLMQFSERSGESLSSKYIGNVFTSQQVFGGSTYRVVDLAYQQRLFDDRLEFRIGRIGASDDFLVSPYNYLFMENAFDGTPVGIFFNSPGMNGYPNATWGAMVKVRPTPRCYVMGGVYNGDSTIRDNGRHGVDFSLDGPVFAIGEAGYQVNGLPGDSQLLGNYKAGAWYDENRLPDFTTGEGKRGNWGFYALFDQVIIPIGARESHRGIGVFGSAVFGSNPNVQQMPFFFTAGAAARGLFDVRPQDAIGLGVAYGHFSNDLKDSQEAAGLHGQEYEMAIELNYRFNFKDRSVFVQPVLQYIIHPGGTGQHNDALVIGAQVGISF